MIEPNSAGHTNHDHHDHKGLQILQVERKSGNADEQHIKGIKDRVEQDGVPGTGRMAFDDILAEQHLPIVGLLLVQRSQRISVSVEGHWPRVVHT